METEKINVEVYNKTTNIKVFTDAGAFEFDLKKSGSFDFVFFKEGYHCRTKQHYNWHP
jgi:Fe(3+) dicitrate transport protein